MRTYGLIVVALILTSIGSTAWANEPPALAKARALYNAGDFEGAIDAASVARTDVEWADAAALVVARAHLEQYRERADAEDLAAARAALGTVRAAMLMPRDQVDLIVGLGLSLYLSESYGAAAELFETALGRAALLAPRDRQLLLDWWATSLDREAQVRPADRRPRVFERIASRMNEEIQRDPGSPVANYWLAVSARGAGDIDAAWNFAIAAWVRSTLSPDTTERLRDDLDRLVTQALIAERSRTLVSREPQDAVAALRTEWELVKQQWK
jgi:tetratricopeptide (TPR) repeat protein